MDQNKLDLNEIATRQDFTLTIAPRADPAERESRLKREEADAAHQRRKDLALHIITFGVIAAAFCICAYVVLNDTAGREETRWATAMLTSIVTGLVGYVTGRSAK